MPSHRWKSVAFAGLAYLTFLVVVLYSVAFVAGRVVARTVDSGGPRSGSGIAVVIDAVLLSLFALHHSVLARPAVKQRWTRIVPAHLERSAYVLVASLLLALAFWQWRPIPHVVWEVHNVVGRSVLWTVFALGWVIVVAMTFAIDHFDLTGISQVRYHVRGSAPAAPDLRVPLPYRIVRHPMMTGFLIAFFATPRMTAGHLLFAGLSGAYIVVAVHFEERDLARTLPEYDAYAASTPRFVPVPRRPASMSNQ